MNDLKTTTMNWIELKSLFKQKLINLTQLEEYYEDLTVKYLEYKFQFDFGIEDESKIFDLIELGPIENEYKTLTK
tara:strand:+ start:75 stop:299 length:225 start_codon:yes stop_codon:yes gene_type:complete